MEMMQTMKEKKEKKNEHVAGRKKKNDSSL